MDDFYEKIAFIHESPRRLLLGNSVAITAQERARL
jgi:hypothetical protein